MIQPTYYSEKRPWGGYILFVDNQHCSIKILTVSGQLSLQSHNFREESWYVLSGRVEVMRGIVLNTWEETKKNLERLILESGETVIIPVKHVHTMRNLGEAPAQILEISTGDYKEDDIIRYEDIYGRV